MLAAENVKISQSYFIYFFIYPLFRTKKTKVQLKPNDIVAQLHFLNYLVLKIIEILLLRKLTEIEYFFTVW